MMLKRANYTLDPFKSKLYQVKLEFAFLSKQYRLSVLVRAASLRQLYQVHVPIILCIEQPNYMYHILSENCDFPAIDIAVYCIVTDLVVV